MDSSFKNFEWIAAVQQSQKIHLASKCVLICLGLHANKMGYAWPSQETLSSESGAGSASVTRAIRDAREAGWLTVEKRPLTATEKRAGQRYESNVYLLNLRSPGSQVQNEPEIIETPNLGSQNQEPGITVIDKDSLNSQGTSKRERKKDSLSHAYERFWDLYPESQRWQGESARVEKVFRRVAKSIDPHPDTGAGILLARAAKYAADFEGSTLNPHNPTRWLEAKGELAAPNDHRGKSKPIDLARMAEGITVRPSKATLEHRERTK